MNTQFKKILFLIVFTAIVANLLILNYIVSNSKKSTEKTHSVLNQQVDESKTCNSCNEYTDEQIQILEEKITPSFTKQELSTTIQEIYLPLGSGETSAKDWENIPGMEASLDTTNYSKIKSAKFETTIKIPNGNQQVWVRLFNKTDKHPAWFSELSHEGGEIKSFTSDPFSYTNGSKIYQVQAKTQLGDRVEILNAKIKLFIQ